MRKAVWQRFGVCLLPGLEFELAADIIRTVVSPTWRDIGGLAAIAALEKDVERAEIDRWPRGCARMTLRPSSHASSSWSGAREATFVCG